MIRSGNLALPGTFSRSRANIYTRTRRLDDRTDKRLRMNGCEQTDIALIDQIGLGDENAFIELYHRRQPGRFKPSKGSVRAWLLGCARLMVLDRMRHESRKVPDMPDEASTPCQGERLVFEQQRLKRLHAAILSLPVEYREAIVLCELEELSYAETAAVLSCPIGTVRSRLHRARKQLVTRLSGAENVESPLLPEASEVSL